MTDALKEGEKVARNVTFSTFLLAMGKLIVAFLTNSIAILADAFHSLSDLIPIIAAWLGLKIAQRPKDEKFPYGYYKAENLAALLASLFIFFLGYEILVESVSRLGAVEIVKNDLLGVSFILVSILISFVLYKYQLEAARRTRSQALMANAKETLMDVLSSVLVLVGFVSAVFGVSWIEGIVGILLAILVFHSGFESAKDSILALMDASVSKEELEELIRAASSVPRVKEVKSLYARKSGPFLMVEAVITVPAGLDVGQAHSIAREVEKKLEKFPQVDHAVVHVEPQKGRKLVARPVSEDGSLAKVFGSAPYFEIYLVSKSGRELVEKVKNPGFGLSKKRGVKAALFLINKGIDEVEVRNIGKDSREILERAGVMVRVVE